MKQRKGNQLGKDRKGKEINDGRKREEIRNRREVNESFEGRTTKNKTTHSEIAPRIT